MFRPLENCRILPGVNKGAGDPGSSVTDLTQLFAALPGFPALSFSLLSSPGNGCKAWLQGLALPWTRCEAAGESSSLSGLSPFIFINQKIKLEFRCFWPQVPMEAGIALPS